MPGGLPENVPEDDHADSLGLEPCERREHLPGVNVVRREGRPVSCGPSGGMYSALG